jgi:ADP-ribosyl-[dinitrogen reductase] hydrolase
MRPDIPPRDRFVGCLLGCAVGDALGAPFEGMWSHTIPDAASLLAGFAEFEGYPRGQYTDDTQLSVATVQAVVEAGEVSPAAIAQSIARLWRATAVIGPGGACTQAANRFLRTGDWRRCGAPIGQAGNGAAMRTAVLGLCFSAQPHRVTEAAAAVSRITHQDPRSVAGGVAVARASQLLVAGKAVSAQAFCDTVADSMAPWESTFAGLVRTLPALLELEAAEAMPQIAWAGMHRPEFDVPIITPFVVPTVLASFWCLLRNLDSWPDAVASAVRLGGDVDTLGAIVGALAGARLGAAAIPIHLAESVVDSERLRELALRFYARVAAGLRFP